MTKHNLTPLVVRFWPKVDMSEGEKACWPWNGPRLPTGYGVIWTPLGKRQQSPAHRVAWEMAYGPIPDGSFVCHVCDNPPCVNPLHLFLGSPADNIADMLAKGREARGTRVRAKLTEDDVREARLLATRGLSMAVIGTRYGVDGHTIWDVVRRRTWKYVV